ncbi:MAG: lipase family alpha/beta hydrolase [Pseudomonadales bacterium]
MAENLSSTTPRGPNLFYSCIELPRVLQEMSLLVPAHSWLKGLNGGKGEPVMTLPGFGADDRSTAILRRYLNRWGYDARPWGVGQNLNPRKMKNLDSVAEMMESNLDQLAERLNAIHKESGQKISLIGWSLGGIVARQLASRHPELVSRVISMGTPWGDFRSTVVFPLMQRFLEGEVEDGDVQAWEELCNAPMKNIPLTIIYSKSDGFVAPAIATRQRSRWVENIEVVCSHVGFGVHPLVFNLLADRLRQPVKNWQHFQPGTLNRWLYKPV